MKTPQFAKEPEENVWATEIPSRNPKFKIHTRVGHAKAAVTNRRRDHESMNRRGWSSPHNAWQFSKGYSADTYYRENGVWVHVPEFSFDPIAGKTVEEFDARWNRNQGEPQMRWHLVNETAV